MKLVVVESPSKAKTINKYLGKDYKVIASKGHVIDLPKSSLGVDVEGNFEPEYVVTKKAALSDLKKAYKEADGLILAVDLDREGEAIGWHVAQKLGAINKDGKAKKGKEVKRIVFSEITEQAVKDAIANPRDIDMDLVDAQQARRVLDRLVGYTLSPLLWKKIQFGLSAGRVQSVAVRLVVEKEEERNAFNPEEYWSFEVPSKLQNHSKEIKEIIVLSDQEEKQDFASDISFSLLKINNKKAKIEDEKTFKKILNDIKNETWKIDAVTESTSKRNPKPPLITSTMQRLAVNKFGYSAKRTMVAAQKLYEAGHITYMRTDSVFMSEQATQQARKYVEKVYGKKYLHDDVRRFKSKQKGAQEAHECIRPVSFMTKPSDLNVTKEQENIYTLIWSHALATQMKPAQVKNVAVDVNINEYLFRANGAQIVFDGFLKVTKDKVAESILPELQEKQEVYPEYFVGVQHFTKPPARYTEASLIKKLEELGIGRPSTYASIISTIQSRKYVEKEGRYLYPTDMGTVVNALLTTYFDNVVDYNFTAGMEENLDKVAEGDKDWRKMMKEFFNPFQKTVKEKEQTITRDEFKVLGDGPEEFPCPVCGSKMHIKLGKNGRFLSCSRFPDCDGIRSIDGKTQEEIENEVNTKEFKETYKPAPKTEDGRDYLLKEGRYGKFWAHPDYPKVKDAKPLEYTDKKLKELYGQPPKAKDGKTTLILRNGRYGPFWAHPDYPKVKEVQKIKKS